MKRRDVIKGLAGFPAIADTDIIEKLTKAETEDIDITVNIFALDHILIPQVFLKRSRRLPFERKNIRWNILKKIKLYTEYVLQTLGDNINPSVNIITDIVIDSSNYDNHTTQEILDMWEYELETIPDEYISPHSNILITGYDLIPCGKANVGTSDNHHPAGVVSSARSLHDYDTPTKEIIGKEIDYSGSVAMVAAHEVGHNLGLSHEHATAEKHGEDHIKGTIMYSPSIEKETKKNKFGEEFPEYTKGKDSWIVFNKFNSDIQPEKHLDDSILEKQ